ncbi:hypothetical protein G9A89_020040 [Geosiphon pyriformis]|nr:hypothetical protein G9A89_020040 [Geosiphon pyriformis]
MLLDCVVDNAFSGVMNEIVVEDTLEKNRELWLILQDMYKAYDLWLDPRGPVSHWFFLTSGFINKSVSLGNETTTAVKKNVLSVLNSDESLRCAGSAEVVGGMAAYFPAVDAGIGVSVAELLSSTLTELQAVVLALNRKSANLHMYLIKAVYRRLPVAVRKRLYNKDYPKVLCLLCNKVELSDHVFTCSDDFGLYKDILVEAAKKWMSMSGLLCLFAFAILLLLPLCSLDASLYITVCKGFVIKDWYVEAVSVFEGKKRLH